jgi:hypothetical protein
MKPSSELVKEWRDMASHPKWNSLVAFRLNECADELQAWLREADEFLADQRVDFSMSAFTVDMLRAKLLGTTRTEDGK